MKRQRYENNWRISQYVNYETTPARKLYERELFLIFFINYRFVKISREHLLHLLTSKTILRTDAVQLLHFLLDKAL